MAQMTVELAEAILKGDGITRHEVEQLCHFFLANKPRIKLEQELIQAQAELAEAKKDQARYQWLKSIETTKWISLHQLCFEQLDLYIDAAIKESK